MKNDIMLCSSHVSACEYDIMAISVTVDITVVKATKSLHLGLCLVRCR